MTNHSIDLVFIVDTSSSDNNVISAIRESIDEIVIELQSLVSKLSVISFNNHPEILEDRIDLNGLDIENYFRETGGMCNVHFALRRSIQLLDRSGSRISCLLLFLTSDPTDTSRLLDDDMRRSITDAEKYLIKGHSTLTEPPGFEGSRTYILGKEKDIDRLIRDIKGLCEDSLQASSSTDTTDFQTIIEETDLRPDVTVNEDESNGHNASHTNEESYVDTKIEFEDEELPSPDIYL